MAFRFADRDLVRVKSGKIYRIHRRDPAAYGWYRGDPNVPEYGGVQIRNGQPYGAYRVFKETALTPVLGPLASPEPGHVWESA